MNDKPHVGAIDTHAERDGRDDDVGPFAEERILVTAAVFVGEAGVIGQCRVADLGQPCRQGVDFAAGRAIDDTGFSACRARPR